MRPIAVLLLSGALARLLVPLYGRSVIDLRAADDFEAMVFGAFCLTLGAVAAWSFTIALVALIRPGLARRLGPAWLLAGLFGLGMIAPAQATNSDSGADLSGLRLPDRAVAAAPIDTPGSNCGHLVEPGDTLWAIAAARLGDSASDAEIAESVHQWALANREVIGDDPNLIFPGQYLVPAVEATC